MCRYVRQIRMQLALNTTLTLDQLNANPFIATAIQNGVLQALGLLLMASATATATTTATFLGFAPLASY